MWWKVKHLKFGFLILHISDKQRVSFISISFANCLFLMLDYLSTCHVYSKKLNKTTSENNVFIVKNKEYISDLALNWSYKNWLIKSLCHLKQHRELESVPCVHMICPPLKIFCSKTANCNSVRISSSMWKKRTLYYRCHSLNIQIVSVSFQRLLIP